IDAAAVDELGTVGIVAADLVDFTAGILGHVYPAGEALGSAQGEIPAGNVQAGHEQIGCTGGLSQVDDTADIALVNVGAEEQQRTLGQASAGLVHGHGSHVGARTHGGAGQTGAEIQVGAV